MDCAYVGVEGPVFSGVGAAHQGSPGEMCGRIELNMVGPYQVFAGLSVSGLGLCTRAAQLRLFDVGAGLRLLGMFRGPPRQRQ